MQYDIIIIGAGPIGLACGIEAEKKGLSYLIIEKGCIVNSIFHYPTNMTFFSTSERLELGGVPFVSHGMKPTRREALEYYRRVADSYKLNIHTYETVESIKGVKQVTAKEGETITLGGEKFTMMESIELNDGYVVKTNNHSYLAKYIIIATGFYDYAVTMDVPGEDLPKVRHYFDEAHPYAYQNVAVIGAGNSAVDVALETYRTGANVTMVIREPELKKGVKYWVRPDIENRIKEGSIKAYFNSTVKEVKEKELVILTPEGEITIPNDFVFAMTGYKPDFTFLEKIGLEVKDNMPVFNRDTLESSKPGIFYAGVILGGMETDKLFIENSIEHGERIIKEITTRNS
ncbi:MAG: YpdA family putative bacillithiol disulfide reductase [Ignavibacteriae bacterium]|nr:YpdA family putative bacillithiol disulfide reductase [Ignavibacteriota bacterium]